MNRYNIYYKQYNIIARDYVNYIKVVYTDDIYHEIGKMICSALEKIDSIHYTKPRASKEECEQYWRANGYEQLSEHFWRLGKKREEEE